LRSTMICVFVQALQVKRPSLPRFRKRTDWNLKLKSITSSSQKKYRLFWWQ
ncbi:hypothetical protein BD410DRAFT_779366, partial [Rickenella mellea]